MLRSRQLPIIFNTSGKLTKTEVTSGQTPPSRYTSTTAYTYDKDGKLISEDKTWSEFYGSGTSTITYSYGDGGELISSYSEGSETGRFSYSFTIAIWYNERGDEIIRREDGSGFYPTVAEYFWKYLYDDNGNIVSTTMKKAQIVRSPATDIVFQTYYDYDKYDNLLRVDIEGANGSGSKTYWYDCW
jgi:hypothetical protein